MKRLLIVLPVFLAVALLPFSSYAQEQQEQQQQEQPPTTAVSLWQCDFAHLEDLVESVNTYMRPAAQEMVDEGLIMNWGMMTHQWGDQWNVVFYTTGPDAAAVMEANREMIRRTGERATEAGEDPDFNPLYEWCSAHKDNIYTNVSGAAPGMEESGS